MLEMFKGVANSPETTITNNISNIDTIIYVLDETRIPTELPNLMVLGTGTGAETVKVLSIADNAITVERGFQGVAKAWNAGTIIARNFTEYDYNALLENVNEVDTRIGPIASLLTRIKTSIINALNGVQEDLDEHKEKNVSEGNPHGIDAKANRQQENWIKATLLNGWTGDIYYRKDELGEVAMKGNCAGGVSTDGTILFTLPVEPVEYVPPAKAYLVTLGSNGSDYVRVLIGVAPSGSVTIDWGQANANLFLDSVRFPTT